MSELNNSYIKYIPDLINYNNDKIKTKTYTTKPTTFTSTSYTTEYKILNYDEEFVCDNDDKLGIYRSIVVNPVDSTILCFTPPKTMTLPFFKDHNPKIVDEINNLLDECLISPFKGTGKPEPLSENLTGFWSRRITHEHRLVYLPEDGAIYIIACRYHYSKK